MNQHKTSLPSLVALVLAAAQSCSAYEAVTYVRFLPDGKGLILRGCDPYKSTVATKSGIFNISDGKIVKAISPKPLLYSPNNSYYVMPGKPMQSYSLNGKSITSFESSSYVAPMAISPDGRYVMGRGSSLMGIWDSTSGKVVTRADVTEPIHFAMNSRGFYANHDGVPSFFEIKRERRNGMFGGLFGNFKIVTRVSLARSYRWARGDNRDFDVNERQGLLAAVFIQLPINQPRLKAPIHIVLMNLKGKPLTKASIRGTLEKDAVNVCFSQDGRYLAIRQSDEVTIYSTHKLRVLRRYKPQSFGLRFFTTIDFSPVDNQLAMGGWGRYAPALVRLPN